MPDLLYDLFLSDAKAAGFEDPETEAKRKMNECEIESAEREAVFNNIAPKNSDALRWNASASFVNEVANKYEVLICTATKAKLNSIIRWSSSRFNQWKKPDFIDKIIMLTKSNVPHYDSGEVVAGSFGAGGVGHGGTFGTSNYATKGAGGTYRLICLNGFVYVFLIDTNQVILFEGDCYPLTHELKAVD
ncbi:MULTISPECIES: hypothetical protein [Pseudoalteromonas]|uniref:hypothetical protein n=1 Tax=Pseudoalteromonas TaxID=53246 RepID=UPI001583E1A9|nr:MULTISPECIES: hypothetical protein [Pseudoalteromonas]MDI4652622.1 hypothetical protein [Pseudoalteromonas shioyasakiensis]NUJ38668.1 hypothetical protein [Pseudoalteromonas sp. 0303]